MDLAIVARLRELAPALAPGGRDVNNLARLTGGASLQTWAFDVRTPQGARALILRRRKAADASAFETSLPLDTEARLLDSASRAGVPTPRVVRACEAQDGLGEALIVERIEGETLGRRIATSASLAQARRGLARQCGEALARIHAMPGDRLPPLETLDAAATLARYAGIYRRSGAERPALEWAMKRLATDLPPPAAPRPVHGDFRNGNLIVTPDRGLAAVLDWELCHLGDPAEDLGWLCVNSWRFGQIENPVGGFGDMPDLLAGYREAGGDPAVVARIGFWRMMGSFRWAVVAGMMYSACGVGEPRSLERALIGRRLSECEVDLLALADRAA